MFKLIGILKKEEIREFIKKDGTKGSSKTFFIEPEGVIYPVKVTTTNIDLKLGKEGEKVSAEVSAFPYYIKEGKRQRAFIDYYIPNK